jgi:phenylacetate-CoA ligase
VTTLEQQIEAQEAWHGRDGSNLARQARQLVASEFEDPQRRHERSLDRMNHALAFAAASVPWYRFLWNEGAKSGFQLSRLESVTELPLLTKRKLQEAGENLRAITLPEGHRYSHASRSSGTTGRPTQVHQTQMHSRVFALLKQREYRWFGMNPRGNLAVLRLPMHLPVIRGRAMPQGAAYRSRGWPTVSEGFETGDAYYYSVFNPVEDQVAWLQKADPHYLVAYAETLEHLAFALEGPCRGQRLESVQSISETLTPDMRKRVEKVFGVPVHQNYGLNELGVVASRCPEGGQYHVHDEFFHVEIIGKEGRPCEPGETGRIVVTNLFNRAMPLIRYDTDDMAVATSGDCACGRTLPTFGEVIGRYSRIAYLPEGTLGQAAIIRDALANLPEELGRPLRKFQIRHFKAGGFELHVQGASAFDPGFEQFFREAWRAALGPDAPRFRLVVADRLEAGPGGKFQDFVSDCTPGAPAAEES